MYTTIPRNLIGRPLNVNTDFRIWSLLPQVIVVSVPLAPFSPPRNERCSGLPKANFGLNFCCFAYVVSPSVSRKRLKKSCQNCVWLQYADFRFHKPVFCRFQRQNRLVFRVSKAGSCHTWVLRFFSNWRYLSAFNAHMMWCELNDIFFSAVKVVPMFDHQSLPCEGSLAN